MDEPAQLGPYRVVRQLGRGGMATVYLAERRGPEGFRKQVALKVIRGDLAANPSFRAMFIEEAKIAQTLAHGNVVQIFELGEVEGDYFIAMEYVAGASLLQLLRVMPDGALPTPIALYVTRCVCRALQHAHTRRDADGHPLTIIHRDVSPHNVLLSDDGQVKLADFGIARALDRLSQSLPGTLKGKVGYLSPEQVEGRSEIDQRSDLFSLGMVAFQMITGENPLAATDFKEGIERALHPRLPPPSELRPGLDRRIDTLIARAVKRAPAERYASAQQWLDELEALRLAQGDATDAVDLAALLQQQGFAEGARPLRSLDRAFAAVLGAANEDPADAGLGDTVPATPRGMNRSTLPSATTASLPPLGAPPTRARLLVFFTALAVLAAVGSYLLLRGPSSGGSNAALEPSDLGARGYQTPGPREVARDAQSMGSDADARRVEVDAGELSRATAAASRGGKGRRRGELFVNLLPWARVTVDGRLIGDTPQRIMLPAGRHRLVLHNPQLDLRRELTVTVEAGKTTRVKKW